MKRPVVCREIIDINAAHVCLNRRKHICNVHTELLAFFPIDRKIIIRRMGRIKTVRMSDRRGFIRLIDKSIDHSLKCMNIIVGISLLDLKTEADHRTDARNRRWLDDLNIGIHQSGVGNPLLHDMDNARHLFIPGRTVVPWFELTINCSAI